MKITLSKLSTKDLATLSQRIINSAESGNFAVISNHPLLAEFKTMYADYDEVYTKQIYSGKGVNVVAADRQRDNAFRVLKNFLNGYRKMTNLDNHQFADDVFQIFKRYGLDIDKESYSTQSAQMKKLVEDLDKQENSQKLNTLSLLPAFNEIKSKQQAFEQVFSEQAIANAHLRQMKNASAIRRDLEKKLKAFLNVITAMKDMPDWNMLYADINELVKAAKQSKQTGIDIKGKDNA